MTDAPGSIAVFNYEYRKDSFVYEIPKPGNMAVFISWIQEPGNIAVFIYEDRKDSFVYEIPKPGNIAVYAGSRKRGNLYAGV